MKKYTVINTAGNRGYATFRIHLAGCRDIPLEERKTFGHSWEIEATDAEDAIRQEQDALLGDDNPHARKEFDVAPCAKPEVKK